MVVSVLLIVVLEVAHVLESVDEVSDEVEVTLLQIVVLESGNVV